jgi:hypothetical protein
MRRPSDEARKRLRARREAVSKKGWSMIVVPTYEQASSCMRNTPPKVRSRRAKSRCDMIGQPSDTL